jgi:hypothetical protein
MKIINLYLYIVTIKYSKKLVNSDYCYLENCNKTTQLKNHKVLNENHHPDGILHTLVTQT